VDGREYILINATGATNDLKVAEGGQAPPSGPKSYVAFALPARN
jgi:hypothetical protein